MKQTNTPVHIDQAKFLKAVTESGNIIQAARENKIDHSTIERLRREDREFNTTLECSLKKHHDLQVEELNKIRAKLLEVAEKALEVRVYQVKSKTKEKIVNRKGVVTGTREWTSVKEKVCEPNIPAVLKALAELSKTLNLQYSRQLISNPDGTLKEQLLGQREAADLSSDDLNWLMNDKIDLYRIRRLQAQTQMLSEKGLLTSDEYRVRFIEEMKIVQDIQSRIEARIRVEFEGKTLLDVRNDMHALLRLHHTLFKQAIANSKINGIDIYPEFQKLLKEHDENEEKLELPHS
ncbi:MAG: hypothetical protein HQ562_09000 [Candidatus Marinimicrobia bacterium]|nr:hypothetical protein [Candidatus Neomarinimicrobiota bacterium]